MCTMSGVRLPPSLWHLALLYFASLVAFTVASNALVIHAVFHTRALRTPSNFFLASLALADLGRGEPSKDRRMGFMGKSGSLSSQALEINILLLLLYCT